MQETQVQSLRQKDPLEEEMATHTPVFLLENPTDRGAWWATVHGVTKELDTTERLNHHHPGRRQQPTRSCIPRSSCSLVWFVSRFMKEIQNLFVSWFMKGIQNLNVSGSLLERHADLVGVLVFNCRLYLRYLGASTFLSWGRALEGRDWISVILSAQSPASIHQGQAICAIYHITHIMIDHSETAAIEKISWQSLPQIVKQKFWNCLSKSHEETEVTHLAGKKMTG